MTAFINTLNPTPWAIFDNDGAFQKDADSMVTFVHRKLGESFISNEITKKDIFASFEESCLEFSAMILEYQARSNLASLLGSPTGSSGSINLTNIYIKPNLEFLERQAQPYADLIGFGSEGISLSGAITLDPNLIRQDYDLYKELIDDNGIPLWQQQPSGSTYKMKILEVFQFMPIQYVFNSNFASNMVAAGLPVESYIPDTRFYVLPLFEDTLRAGMLKAAQKVRRSQYSYKIFGRFIRLYPSPAATTPFSQKVWIRVGFVPSVAPGISTIYGTGSALASGSIQDDKLWGVSNPANIPYQAVPYTTLNSWAKNWIRNYTLASCKEQIGLVRSKLKSLPVPNGESIQLNGEELITQGREDKKDLKDRLKEVLESLDYYKLQELEATKAEMVNKQLSFTPINPFYAIKIW